LSPDTIFPFGPFEYDFQRKLLLRGKNPQHVPRNPLKALEYVLNHRDRLVSYDDLINAIWGNDKTKTKDKTFGKTPADVRKTVQDYFRLLTHKGHAFISLVPQQGYQFVPLPGEELLQRPLLKSESDIRTVQTDIDAESGRLEHRSSFSGIASSEAPPRDELSSFENRDFALIVDGMIINSAGEVLHEDSDTTNIRNLCGGSYERCLEDLAFAAVYASRLVTAKDFRPSITKPNQPGLEVAARLGEICEQRSYPNDISDGRLLHMEETRNNIRADIQRLAKCVADKNHVHFFRDYMVREATKSLGMHLSLFQEDFDPAKYEYDVKRPYYQHRELQDALGKEATETLASFLPKRPPNSEDLYATNALREFVTRNVLSLITIMWESDTFAKRTGAWRMPHILRTLVAQQREHDPSRIQHQQLVRDLVVQHALMTALGQLRNKTRENMMAALLNLRDDRPFKQIRQRLNSEHLIFIEPDEQKEKDARRLIKELKSLINPSSPYIDPVTFAERSTYRAWGLAKAADYENELYRVFPELRPKGT
jgi:DNA-binding winged helix-turn-helix (wHTH) protein